MLIEKTYVYQGKSYRALIEKKRIRNTYLRLKPNGEISVTTSLLTSNKTIDDFVAKSLPKLIKRVAVSNTSPIVGENVYILGDLVPNTWENIGKLHDFMKKESLKLFVERVRFYEGLMIVKKPYDVGSRFMKTRFGSNSKKTHKIWLSSELYHYPIEVIDSVVVHELAHHFRFDHSDKFYQIVYTFCPDYKRLHAKLRKRQYGKDYIQG